MHQFGLRRWAYLFNSVHNLLHPRFAPSFFLSSDFKSGLALNRRSRELGQDLSGYSTNHELSDGCTP